MVKKIAFLLPEKPVMVLIENYLSIAQSMKMNF